jgi:hypothetical protein
VPGRSQRATGSANIVIDCKDGSGEGWNLLCESGIIETLTHAAQSDQMDRKSDGANSQEHILIQSNTMSKNEEA